MKLQIVVDGSTYEVEVEVLEEDPGARNPGLLPAYPSTVPSIAAPASPKATPVPENVDESKVCPSPVAGVVLRVNVKPGHQLQPNERMMVLEDMKMETNVTAPVAGKVQKVNANLGDAVKVNQILVEFE